MLILKSLLFGLGVTLLLLIFTGIITLINFYLGEAGLNITLFMLVLLIMSAAYYLGNK